MREERPPNNASLSDSMGVSFPARVTLDDRAGFDISG